MFNALFAIFMSTTISLLVVLLWILWSDLLDASQCCGLLMCVVCDAGRVPRTVASVKQHLLASDDVVSCCMDLNAPSISFRINGQPVQGMFETFNLDGLFFPVVSFSAGVKYVKHRAWAEREALALSKYPHLQSCSLNQHLEYCYSWLCVSHHASCSGNKL